jgi:hypothetical protein
MSFAKTLQRHKSRPVTMLRARPHAIHFKRILDFGEGQDQIRSTYDLLAPHKRRACGANFAAAVLGGFLTRSQTAFTVIPSPHARTVAVPGWVSTELDDWLAAAATGTRR